MGSQPYVSRYICVTTALTIAVLAFLTPRMNLSNVRALALSPYPLQRVVWSGILSREEGRVSALGHLSKRICKKGLVAFQPHLFLQHVQTKTFFLPCSATQ